MPNVNDRAQVHLETLDALRAWFEVNHATSPGVWFVSWRAATGRPVIPYEAVVEEALCWGWIDGQAKLLDADRSMILLAPRNPRSGWAKTNKARVQRLLAAGRIQPPGLRAIEIAKATGAWTLLDASEAGLTPDDLAAALAANPPATANWEAFPRSVRKQAIGWVTTARRSETRERRVAEIARLAQANIRPLTRPERPGGSS